MPRPLDQARYICLETFRKNGAGVRTAVWFAAAPDEAARFYVYTSAEAGKAKRIRRNGAVKIAACDMRGTVEGPWFDATATLVDGAEFATGMRLLNRKYWPWKQVLDLSAKLFGRHQRAMICLHPAPTGDAARG